MPATPNRTTVHAMRISLMRFKQHIMPKSNNSRVRLEPTEDKDVLMQLREILTDKKKAKRMVEQLEIWDDSRGRDPFVSRKEFRQAFYVLGYLAPKDALKRPKTC